MDRDTRQIVAAVVGPTACGKTALSVRLGQALGAEIICADSMQIYRDMPIGTAAPTEEEKGSVPHHLFEWLDPMTPYSCAAYTEDAGRTVANVASRGALPLFCGGTGLYLDAFLRGASFEETVSDPAVKEELTGFLAEKGRQALHDRLRAVDPASAEAIHPNNEKRVLRALEIYMLTGKTKTAWDAASQTVPSPYRAAVVGIRFSDRELLYRRIDARVDAMMRAGLAEETERLASSGVFAANATAAQAIGYKELLGYLDGRESLADAVTRLKTATRHYAKRQMTWFSARPYVHWIDADREGRERPAADVLGEALAFVRSELGLS